MLLRLLLVLFLGAPLFLFLLLGVVYCFWAVVQRFGAKSFLVKLSSSILSIVLLFCEFLRFSNNSNFNLNYKQ